MSEPSFGAELNEQAGVHIFTHPSMGTTFRLALAGVEAKYAEQASWAAFDLLDEIAKALSHRIEYSDISRINAAPPGQAVRVEPTTWECLQAARRMHEATGGAFDITAAGVLAWWAEQGEGAAEAAGPEQYDEIRRRAGMAGVLADPLAHSVTLARERMRIDLGGIGKGYAVDRMAEILRDWSIDRALIDAGQSTALALGSAGAFGGWPVVLRDPRDGRTVFGRLGLQGRAIAGSGIEVHGRHILDPRSGRPVLGRLSSWAMAADATTADALSTAFMVMSLDEIEQYCRRDPQASAMVLAEDGQLARFGQW